MSSPHPASKESGPVIERLAARHETFLSFLERRIEDRTLAEDILQSAFARATDKAAQLRDEESAVAWFYRLLRNAVVDHWRSQQRQQQRLERLAAELEDESEPELRQEICNCVEGLLDELEPSYARAIRRIDLEGLPVKAFAQEAASTPNNAGVRVHRARQALRRQLERCCGACAEHGCLDCSCKR